MCRFDHLNLPLTGCPKLNMSLLVVACSVCILSLSILTTIFFTLLLFIIMISLLPSFLHTVEVLDALNISINLANVAAFCFGKLKTNHCKFLNNAHHMEEVRTAKNRKIV